MNPLSSTQDMFDRIYAVVAEIPSGKVMSYQAVAQAAGVKSPRWVGRAMHANTDPACIPCHRVVHQDGKLAPGYAFGGKDMQKSRLLKEGIQFISDRVDMAACATSASMFK